MLHKQVHTTHIPPQFKYELHKCKLSIVHYTNTDMLKLQVKQHPIPKGHVRRKTWS